MLKKIILLMLSVPLFSSCVLYRTGNVSSGPLLHAGDQYVSVARGEAKSFTVLGIGGFKRDGLVLDAKADLYRNRPLKSNENYSNFSTSVAVKYVLVVRITKVIVGADVMNSANTDVNDKMSQEYRIMMKLLPGPAYFKTELDSFSVGEIVYANAENAAGKFYRMEVMSVNGKKVNLRHLDSFRQNRVIKYETRAFFSATRTIQGFKAGDKVIVNSTLHQVKNAEGTVLGVSSKYMLVSTEDGISTYYKEFLKKR